MGMVTQEMTSEIKTSDMPNMEAESPVSTRQSKHMKVNAAWQTTKSSLGSTDRFHIIFAFHNCCPIICYY